jgi:hypothetical protein
MSPMDYSLKPRGQRMGECQPLVLSTLGHQMERGGLYEPLRGLKRAGAPRRDFDLCAKDYSDNLLVIPLRYLVASAMPEVVTTKTP